MIYDLTATYGVRYNVICNSISSVAMPDTYSMQTRVTHEAPSLVRNKTLNQQHFLVVRCIFYFS